jgi:hypothetical protein
MMFLPGLAVVFAGLVGGNNDVDGQLHKVLASLHVKSVSVPSSSVQTLTHHSSATTGVVKSLHADGVIACEVVKGNTLRVVIYDGDGRLKTFSEVPLAGKKLEKSQLESLRSNLADDLASMRGDDEPVVEEPIAEPKPEPKPIAPSGDDENPLGSSGSSGTTASQPVASADDSEAVSIDEIAAMTETTESEPASTTVARTLQLGLSAGLGIATRSFSPGPATLMPYSSSPVAAVVIDAHVQPTLNPRA